MADAEAEPEQTTDAESEPEPAGARATEEAETPPEATDDATAAPAAVAAQAAADAQAAAESEERRAADLPPTPIDRWEASMDRINVENLVAMRQELEILGDQGDSEGVARVQAAMDRVPVSQEIRDGPQAYLDRLAAEDGAQAGRDTATAEGDAMSAASGSPVTRPDAPVTPIDRWEASMDRINAENLVAMRQELEILGDQGDSEGVATVQAAMDRVPVSQEIRDDPQGYLNGLNDDAAAVRMDMSSDRLRAEESWMNTVMKDRRGVDAGERHQAYLSGHGAYVMGSGTTVVPEGKTFTMYAPLGSSMTNSLGQAIETGQEVGGSAPIPDTSEVARQPDDAPLSEAFTKKTYGPGDTVPNFTLFPPDSEITVLGDPDTVAKPTQLADLWPEGEADVHWVACTELLDVGLTPMTDIIENPTYSSDSSEAIRALGESERGVSRVARVGKVVMSATVFSTHVSTGIPASDFQAPSSSVVPAAQAVPAPAAETVAASVETSRPDAAQPRAGSERSSAPGAHLHLEGNDPDVDQPDTGADEEFTVPKRERERFDRPRNERPTGRGPAPPPAWDRGRRGRGSG